jgi:hypothetical protein
MLQHGEPSGIVTAGQRAVALFGTGVLPIPAYKSLLRPEGMRPPDLNQLEAEGPGRKEDFKVVSQFLPREQMVAFNLGKIKNHILQALADHVVRCRYGPAGGH